MKETGAARRAGEVSDNDMSHQTRYNAGVPMKAAKMRETSPALRESVSRMTKQRRGVV